MELTNEQQMALHQLQTHHMAAIGAMRTYCHKLAQQLGAQHQQQPIDQMSQRVRMNSVVV